MELSQSRKEQQEYLKNVELARVLDKRAERKRKVDGDEEQPQLNERPPRRSFTETDESKRPEKKRKKEREKPEQPTGDPRQLDSVLSSIF